MNPRFVCTDNVSHIGTRVHVWGNSCSGKSTLAAKIGEVLDLPVVELDALNWETGWVSVRETEPDKFIARVTRACEGDRWVVAGSYSDTSTEHIWPKVQSVIWLDLPRWLLMLRAIRRCWKRAWTGELLWGKVQERFLPQLMIWRGEESLLWWIWTQHARKRSELRSFTLDPQFAHIQFFRFTSSKDADAWLASLQTDYKK